MIVFKLKTGEESTAVFDKVNDAYDRIDEYFKNSLGNTSMNLWTDEMTEEEYNMLKDNKEGK